MLFSQDAFKGKCVVIAGGAGDIGMAISKRFAQAGIAKIALLDKDAARLEDAVSTLIKQNVQAVSVEVDLSKKESI